MKKIYFSLMAMAIAVCFTACNSKKDEPTPEPKTFDVNQILGSWTVTSYSYIVTNTDADTAVVKDVRQNAGEITIEKDEDQYLFTETFTDPEWGEHSGDVLLHETTFDLRGTAVEYPHLNDLSVKNEGGKTTWESSDTGTATYHRSGTGIVEEDVTYNFKIEVKIAVTKK